jgi:acetylglutamate kinase
MDKLTILKIGGNVLEDTQMLDHVLSYFSQLPSPSILVHGGGKKASEMINKLGLKSQMINGRRVTDAATLEIVTMVYAGLTNKQVVAQLQAKGCNALGLSGADANVILAQQRPVVEIDYGFAGDIQEVNYHSLIKLLQCGFTPVCCAITHDKKGQLLNTNADTIAASIAKSLACTYKVDLQFCFEKTGVLSDPNDDRSVIPQMREEFYQKLKSKGAIHSGMIPKLDNAFAALQAGVYRVMIGNLTTLRSGEATILKK